VRASIIHAVLVLTMATLPSAFQSVRPTAPESFKANAQVIGGVGGVASIVSIQIDRYTSDADHRMLADALAQGGHAAFVEALRKAAAVGTVKIGERGATIRWAREQALKDGGRRIAVATDEPLFFVGGGAVDAAPTTGFDIGILEFTVDDVGLGKGTMAAAAHVKPGGETGVQVEDYAGKRIRLVTVTRNISQ
jgi:hypothetical protein